MSIFGNLKTDGLEDAQDRLGGFSPLATDLYTGTITMAYAGQSEGGALNVTLVVGINGKEFRETIYVTNKQKENFFLNAQDKTKKVPLPGFTTINDICLVTTEKPLSDQDIEEKTIKMYDFEAKKEMPKSAQVLVELIGKEVSLGILNVLENKKVKNEKTGAYEPTADTREINTIDKVFHTDTKKTVVELLNSVEKPEFWDGWLERNKGKQRDKRDVKEGQAGKPVGAPPSASSASAAAPRKSLFGK